MGLFGGLLSGLGGIVGSIFGANDNSKAVNKASKATQAGLQQAIAEQQRQFDLTRSDFAPYLKAGTGALGGLSDLLGLNGNDKAGAAIAALKASPEYQSLYNNGLETNLQNASATGGLRGGNEQRGLADFGSDTLNQVISNQLSRLGGVAGMGEGATNSVAGFGQNTANQIGGYDVGIGQAKAGGILGQQAVWNNFSNQLSSIIGKFAASGGF